MAKSTQSSPDKEEKSPNVLEKAMEKIEAALHSNRNDIDENTPLSVVKAPNLFERAKEEIEAVVEAIHHRKESQTSEDRDESVETGSKPEKSEKEVMIHNLIGKAKEKIEAMTHHKKSLNHHQTETHGRRDDTDENTPVNEVKGPSAYERAKEEHEALVETIHPKKESSELVPSLKEKIEVMTHHERAPSHHQTETHGRRDDIDENTPVNEVKGPSVFERAKEELEALVETIHPKKESSELVLARKEKIEALPHHERSPSHHQTETHGRRDDIDENTPVSEVKGPSVLERAKEELEALVETIHPKKESSELVPSPKEENGFWSSVGRWLEKVCSPLNTKKDLHNKEV